MLKKKKKKESEVLNFEKNSITVLPVEKIIPYDRNPRKNDETIPILVRSIKDFGFNVPLVVDSKNFVVCGHARLIAAKTLGLKELPCIRVSDLTQEQIKAFRLVDNKVAEASKWNERLLKLELFKIKQFKVDSFKLETFGFKIPEKKEVAFLNDSNTGVLSRDYIIPPLSVINGTNTRSMNLDVKWEGIIKPYKVDYPPNLAEVMFRWFTPEEGVILDPYYKSEAKRIIAGTLGYGYKDSIDKVDDSVDMIFLDLAVGACPGMSLQPYLKEIEKSINYLADDRFVVAVIQERNDNTMGFRSSFASELADCLEQRGFGYYNELIYITRKAEEADADREKFYKNRILPQRHRTIMVFFKGKIKNIRNDFSELCPEYVGGDLNA